MEPVSLKDNVAETGQRVLLRSRMSLKRIQSRALTLGLGEYFTVSSSVI